MLMRWFARAIICSAIFASAAQARTVHLVVEDALLRTIEHEIPAGFQVIAKSRLNSANLIDPLTHGDSCVWIGDPAGLPPDLWIGAFRPAQSALEIGTSASSPLLAGEIAFQKALVSSAYIKPVVEMPHHNVDEEIRAGLEPILEARDRFGRVIGYPGVLMRYYAPSLVRHRFAGSECFLFLFDKPVEAALVQSCRVLDNHGHGTGGKR
jgi:hypothetical protein